MCLPPACFEIRSAFVTGFVEGLPRNFSDVISANLPAAARFEIQGRVRTTV